MLDETQPIERPRQVGPSPRTFTVRDMMIMVAAVALGILGYRANNATMIE